MKIAFVYDVIYPYVKGGVEKRIWELAIRLTSRGHEVHLFGMKFWDGEDNLIRGGGVPARGLSRSKTLFWRQEDLSGSPSISAYISSPPC